MPALPDRPRYAARLNAFKTGLPGKPTVADLIGRAGQVSGLNAADLNFPDHFDHHTPAELTGLLGEKGMALNGLAMRYYTDPGFRLGAFTNPDRKVRQAALDITKRGLDVLAAIAGRLAANPALTAAPAMQDATASLRILADLLYK